MKKRGSAQGNHKWDITWSDKLNEPVDKCIYCGLLRRQRQNYVKGEIMKAGKIYDHLVNDKWQIEVPDCKN